MALTAAEKRARSRARRRAAVALRNGTGDGEAALLDLLRSYHRAGAVGACRRIEKDNAHAPEVVQIAIDALAEFDRQMPLSVTELLNVLEGDGHRRWTNLFAQVSDRSIPGQRSPEPDTQGERRRRRTIAKE